MSDPLVRCMRRLAGWPLPRLHALGAPLGWLTYLASPSYRRRFRANARQAGVPWREARAAVSAAGRLMMELPPLWLRPPGAPLPMPVQWEGEALLRRSLAAGRGLVLLTPHMGCFEVAGQSVVAASEEKVTTLLFLNQYVFKGAGKDRTGPEVYQVRVVVTAVPDGDEWLVDDLEAL